MDGSHRELCVYRVKMAAAVSEADSGSCRILSRQARLPMMSWHLRAVCVIAEARPSDSRRDDLQRCQDLSLNTERSMRRGDGRRCASENSRQVATSRCQCLVIPATRLGGHGVSVSTRAAPHSASRTCSAVVTVMPVPSGSTWSWVTVSLSSTATKRLHRVPPSTFVASKSRSAALAQVPSSL